MTKFFFWVSALFYIVDSTVVARFNEKLKQYREQFPKTIEADDEDDSNPNATDSLTPVSMDTENII